MPEHHEPPEIIEIAELEASADENIIFGDEQDEDAYDAEDDI